VKRTTFTKVVWGSRSWAAAWAARAFGAAGLALFTVAAVGAQVRAQQPADAPKNASGTVPTGVVLPTGYVIGPEDVLSIVFWRDKELSADVVVRPDGKISVPLLNDVQAAGYTPEQLRGQVEKAAKKYIEDPSATVIVKAINSRKVHILGNVGKAGTYPLAGDMTVLQCIALAGGLQEYADAKNITIMRKEDGQDRAFKFNYKDVVKGKNLEQNIALKPGDTIIVP
jgi:polysaccharide biosynthesis/export protein